MILNIAISVKFSLPIWHHFSVEGNFPLHNVLWNSFHLYWSSYKREDGRRDMGKKMRASLSWISYGPAEKGNLHFNSLNVTRKTSQDIRMSRHLYYGLGGNFCSLAVCGNFMKKTVETGLFIPSQTLHSHFELLMVLTYVIIIPISLQKERLERGRIN